MRFAISAIAFAASLAFVNAQDLGDIPSCAVPCFASAVPASGCSLSDTKCQCTTGADKIAESITSCAPSKCSTEDVAKIAPAVQAICAKAGISLSSVPTSVPTSNSSSNASKTASVTGVSGTASGSPAQQTTGAAVANAAGLGAIALGLAAGVFGL